jgi:antitoxin component of MazEF toxin-antitoxin module
MIPLTRKMVIVRAPCTEASPMIRISNKFLSDAGFEIGNQINVSYEMDKIIINKIYKQNHEKIEACGKSVGGV